MAELVMMNDYGMFTKKERVTVSLRTDALTNEPMYLRSFLPVIS